MRRVIGRVFGVLLLLGLPALTGCGGLAMSPGISPASFLLPGLVMSPTGTEGLDMGVGFQAPALVVSGDPLGRSLMNSPENPVN